VPYNLSVVDDGSSIPLDLVSIDAFADYAAALGEIPRRWLSVQLPEPEAGACALLPGTNGMPGRGVVVISTPMSLWDVAPAASTFPQGDYHIATELKAPEALNVALAWGLAAYRFDRYKKQEAMRARLRIGKATAKGAERLLAACYRVRDLVNTPAQDLGPEQLATQVHGLAQGFGASISEWVGDELLTAGFPAIHAVGRASQRRPRLLCLRWGEEQHPLVAVVGKGVCFDTGGLDIKPSQYMRDMKKDMGGAAHAFALAELIMASELPLRLLLVIPAVDNAVGPDSYRPGDVLSTRAGLSVEVGNTDAEGRLVLADALAFAGEEKPAFLVDFATLTGAARTALGGDLPALFTNRDATAEALLSIASQCDDPLWRLPLYAPYREMLHSEIADLNNITRQPLAGCITAGLFLQHFVPRETDWMHLDVWAWNASGRPGRPQGGEAQGLRSVFAYLEQRFGSAVQA